MIRGLWHMLDLMVTQSLYELLSDPSLRPKTGFHVTLLFHRKRKGKLFLIPDTSNNITTNPLLYPCPDKGHIPQQKHWTQGNQNQKISIYNYNDIRQRKSSHSRIRKQGMAFLFENVLYDQATEQLSSTEKLIASCLRPCKCHLQSFNKQIISIVLKQIQNLEQSGELLELRPLVHEFI